MLKCFRNSLATERLDSVDLEVNKTEKTKDAGIPLWACTPESNSADCSDMIGIHTH